MNALTIADRSIRMDGNSRFSLNDLHRAGGRQSKHRPSIWLANRQTKDLIAELDAEAGIPALAVQRGGARAGTYACREAALAFAAWISPSFHVRVLRAADAVLTGQTQQPQPDMSAALRDPATLRALLVDQVDERLRLERRVAEQAPRAAAFERLTDQRGAVSVTQAAKLLRVKPRRLFAFLVEQRWTFRASDFGTWQAFQRRIDEGYLTHRMHPVLHGDGRERLHPQAMVTPKGLARLALLLDAESTPSTSTT